MINIFEDYYRQRLSESQALEYIQVVFRTAVRTFAEAKNLRLVMDRCRIKERWHDPRQQRDAWLIEMTFHDEEYAQYKKIQMDYQGGWRDPLDYPDITIIFTDSYLNPFPVPNDDKEWLTFSQEDRINIRICKALFEHYGTWAKNNGWLNIKQTYVSAMDQINKQVLDSIKNSSPILFKPKISDDWKVEVNQAEVNKLWQKQMQDNIARPLTFGKDYWVNGAGKVIITIDGEEKELDYE